MSAGPAVEEPTHQHTSLNPHLRIDRPMEEITSDAHDTPYPTAWPDRPGAALMPAR